MSAAQAKWHNEPRRKQIINHLNPRGAAWSKDENNFGKKLMEKMGWSKGKGLGKELQGEKDHISVKIKNNEKGLGYKGNDDAWIKHFEDFENVLADLNSTHNNDGGSISDSAQNSKKEDSNPISLEASSKNSRARVHYHKFTRGKDLSKYDADAIGCVTGAKRSKILADVEEKLVQEDKVKEEQDDSDLTTVKEETVQEYFAKKMAKFKEKNQRISLPDVYEPARKKNKKTELASS